MSFLVVVQHLQYPSLWCIVDVYCACGKLLEVCADVIMGCGERAKRGIKAGSTMLGFFKDVM